MLVILRGFRYLRPYLHFAIGAFFSTLIVTAANLYSPQLIQQLIDNGITAQSWNGILFATVGLLIIAVVRSIFSFTNTYWSENASQGVAYDLRNEIFTKLQNLSFSFHDRNQTGQLMTRATSDVEGVRSFFAQGVLQLLSTVITLIGSIVILVWTNWQLALAALTTIPPIILIFLWLFSRMGPLFGRVQRALGQLNNILQENIAGVRVVKAFAGEAYELTRYQAQNETLYTENISVRQLFALGFPTIFLLSNLGTLIVIWYGGTLVIGEQLQLGELIAFNSYLTYLLQPIFQLGGLSQQVARAIASGTRLFEVLDEENDIVSPASPIPLPENTQGRVTFEHVSFSYLDSDTEVLSDISFEAHPGETVALLGATGSGKSSIVNLIPRFYDVTAGRVLIDGIDVRDIELLELRRSIGMVLQSVTLVSGTIRDNIRYGRPDAPDNLVEHAAMLAQAHQFITEQPNGYDTVLGERGTGLSGGQRQRIAIARVILEHPRIIIFDDSMSALDADTERKLTAALEPYLDHHTSIIIAQRISTVRNANLILVLDKGKIVARGMHDDLLKNSPIYADIVSSQLENA